MINCSDAGKHILIFSSLIFAIALESFSEATDVFGGIDNRIRYFKMAEKEKLKPNLSYLKELASAVCLITNASYITTDNGSTIKSRLYQRFRNKPDFSAIFR